MRLLSIVRNAKHKDTRGDEDVAETLVAVNKVAKAAAVTDEGNNRQRLFSIQFICRLCDLDDE